MFHAINFIATYFFFPKVCTFPELKYPQKAARGRQKPALFSLMREKKPPEPNQKKTKPNPMLFL